MCHRNSNLGSFDVDFARFNAFQTVDFLKVQISELFAGNIEISRAQCRSHNAAGGAENRCRTGIFAQRTVRFFVMQLAKINAGLFNHSGQFAGRNRYVDILKTGTAHIFAADDFPLFGRAGHNRNHADFGRINTHLLCIIGFGHRANH